MKANLLVLFFLISFFGVNAQEWCAPGAEWTYQVVAEIGIGICKIKYEKDTVIDQKSCKMLIQAESYDWDIDNYFDSKRVLYTYANQDTVFIYQYDQFRPLYFFNANIGDTLEFGDSHMECCPNRKKVVTSKGTMVVNNDTLRYYDISVINCNNFLYNPYQLKIVEKFGSLWSLMLPLYNCYSCPNSYELSCYHDDIIGDHIIYPNPICESSTSTHDINTIDFNITPNPANESITISGLDNIEIKSIEIISVNGSKGIIIDDFKPYLKPINISNLIKGFYFINIVCSDGKQGTKKFVKQ